MKVAITGSQNWGDHAEAAEEVIAGFISKLPKNCIILTGGMEEGVELWANRYAKAYKFRVTEFAPTQVKGAAHYVRNFSQRDRNIAENSERLFCFLYANSEPEDEIANIMVVVRLEHVAHTIYTLAPDEEKEDRLKLVNVEQVEAVALLPVKEKNKDGHSRSRGHTKSPVKPKSNRRLTSKPVQSAATSRVRRARRSKQKVQGKSIVLTRHTNVGKNKSDSAVSTQRTVARRDKRVAGRHGKAAKNRSVVLKRVNKGE